MKIILQPDEVTVCQMIGRMRSLIARSSGVKDAKMGDQDGAEADVIGMMAEYAFAKQFNVFPDLGLSPRSGSADGVVKGKRYDIKATTYKTGRLLCTVKDNPDVDVYILAIVSGNEIDIAGWEYKENLRKEENLIDLGHGKGFALTQDKLQKF
jgi:hypothetical protein